LAGREQVVDADCGTPGITAAACGTRPRRNKTFTTNVTGTDVTSSRFIAPGLP